MIMIRNKTTQHKDSDSEEEDEIPEEVVKVVENFENKPKSNLDETKAINLGDVEAVKETRISIHLSPSEKKEYIYFIKEYEDIFAWSYDDMIGLSTSIVANKLPTNPMCMPVKQKHRKFKPNMSIKIKEEVTKHIKAKDLRVVEYPTWLANIVLVPKKDGNVKHDETGRKEQVIYYFSMKFTSYEARYSLLERACCALTWTAQKLWHCFCAYTTHLISRIDPLKYIFQKPMPTGKRAKWQILLSEFDNIYVTQKVVKGQALADHFAENTVGGEHEPLKTYYPDEEVSFVGEDIAEAYDVCRMFFEGAANFKGVGIGAVLVSKTGQHYLVSVNLRFSYTNNMAEYEACIMGLNLAIDMNIQELLVISDSDLLVHQVQGEWVTKYTKILPYLYRVQELIKRFTKIEFKHVSKIQNEFVDALVTLSSMIQHPDKNFIDPIPVKIHYQLAYYSHVEEEMDGKSWFHNINKYLAKGEYPKQANHTQKRTLWRLSNHLFQRGGTMYIRTPDLGLLRYIQKCHQRQVHADMIKVPPNEFNATSAPWPFAAWGMDVIGPIKPTTSNGHRFILVSIYYFTKWVEVASYKTLTKKVIADFVKDRIVCRFGVPESIITDNAANLNIYLMKVMYETFKIKDKHSTTYMTQMNGAVEAANKNIMKILRKMVENNKKWHEKLPFSLLGYRTMVCTSTGETHYLLVYGTEDVILAKVEIPSLRIIQEAELSDGE
ncbi:uncharacterized protein [Nicotiana sylvestris]|uniref:uncharacterized protein n=1 Tax=Nicotiana sylvestris TaxID=4096 RepID=UPI00388C6404